METDDFSAIDDLWADVTRQTAHIDRRARLADLRGREAAGETMTNDERLQLDRDIAVEGVLSTKPTPERRVSRDQTEPQSVAEVGRRTLEATMGGSGLPLDTLGATIGAKLRKADDFMISAGKDLIEARERVAKGEAGELLDWKGWLRVHDIGEEKAKVCLRIANDPNPEQALAVHRAKNKQAVAKYRSQPAPTGYDVIPAHSEVTPTAAPAVAPVPEPRPAADPVLAQLVALWRQASPGTRAAFMEHIGQPSYNHPSRLDSDDEAPTTWLPPGVVSGIGAAPAVRRKVGGPKRETRH